MNLTINNVNYVATHDDLGHLHLSVDGEPALVLIDGWFELNNVAREEIGSDEVLSNSLAIKDFIESNMEWFCKNNFERFIME